MDISDDFKEQLILDKLENIEDYAHTYRDLSNRIKLDNKDTIMVTLLGKLLHQVNLLKELLEVK